LHATQSVSKPAQTENAQERLSQNAARCNNSQRCIFGQLHCATPSAESILARFFITWLLRWEHQKKAEAAMKPPLHSSAAAATRQPFARPRPTKKNVTGAGKKSQAFTPHAIQYYHDEHLHIINNNITTTTTTSVSPYSIIRNPYIPPPLTPHPQPLTPPEFPNPPVPKLSQSNYSSGSAS
jgi:hypothetical protein